MQFNSFHHKKNYLEKAIKKELRLRNDLNDKTNTITTLNKKTKNIKRIIELKADLKFIKKKIEGNNENARITKIWGMDTIIN